MALDVQQMLQQLPQVEAMCERLYNAQVSLRYPGSVDRIRRRQDGHTPRHTPVALQSPQERSQAEQVLRPFGQSTEYLPHCKVRVVSMQDCQ